MTTTIYFVTENFIKRFGLITDNTDVTDFSPLVQFAAKAYVKRQIGTFFFDSLLAKYNAQTLSTDEQAVVEKMQWAILWRATAHAAISLTYQLKNIGLQKQDSENSVAADLNETRFIYDHYIQQAILFENELKEYLLENKDLYPEFTSTENKPTITKGNNNFNEGVGFLLI